MRVKNSGSSDYTTNKSENDSLVRAGWRAEDIGWYGVGTGAAADANVHYSIYLSALEEVGEEQLNYGYDSVGGINYYLYDITGDGIKEMFIQVSHSESDKTVYVFTIKNGLTDRIYENDGWSHTGIAAAQGRSVIYFYGQMGEFMYGRLRWDGSKIVNEEISSVSNVANGYDYADRWNVEWNNRVKGMTQLKQYDGNDYSPLK